LRALLQRFEMTALASRRADLRRLRCLWYFFFIGAPTKQLRKIFDTQNKRSECRGVRERPAGFRNNAAAT